MTRHLFRYIKPISLSIFILMMVVASCGFQDGSNPLSSDNTSMTADDDGVALLLKPGNGKGNNTTTDATASTTTSETADATASTTTATPDYVTSKMIRAKRGGMIVLNTTDLFYTLEIPPNALNEDTRITLTIPDASQSMFLLEPHGLQFNVPVELIIDAKVSSVALLDPSDAADDEMDVYYYDEEGSKWVGQGATVGFVEFNNWITATVELQHFSRYALGGDSPSNYMIQKYYYASYY